MNTVERLLLAADDVWKEYNKHPFVMGIQNGDLDKEKFRYYMIQDYLYLEDYAKTFAVGVAKAKSLKIANLFAKYISVMNGELNVHKGYLSRLKVTDEDIKNTPRSLDNLSYTSYMLRVAYEEGEGEILTAILSCAYSYEIIAKNIVKTKPDSINDDFYGDWIKGYASEEYAKNNAILLNELNILSENYTEAQLKHLADIFTSCSRYELAFWEMSWNMSK